MQALDDETWAIDDTYDENGNSDGEESDQESDETSDFFEGIASEKDNPELRVLKSTTEKLGGVIAINSGRCVCVVLEWYACADHVATHTSWQINRRQTQFSTVTKLLDYVLIITLSCRAAVINGRACNQSWRMIGTRRLPDRSAW
jgi:hypothetical protein